MLESYELVLQKILLAKKLSPKKSSEKAFKMHILKLLDNKVSEQIYEKNQIVKHVKVSDMNTLVDS